jgi:ankyrin repeat protein
MHITDRPISTEQKLRNNIVSPLSSACLKGEFEIVKSMIESGADVNQCDQANLTSLIYAALNGDENIVRLLISYGAKINYNLLCSIKTKIETIEENVKEGKENACSLTNWENLLDFLIQEGKRQ